MASKASPARRGSPAPRPMDVERQEKLLRWLNANIGSYESHVAQIELNAIRKPLEAVPRPKAVESTNESKSPAESATAAAAAAAAAVAEQAAKGGAEKPGAVPRSPSTSKPQEKPGDTRSRARFDPTRVFIYARPNYGRRARIKRILGGDFSRFVAMRGAMDKSLGEWIDRRAAPLGTMQGARPDESGGRGWVVEASNAPGKGRDFISELLMRNDAAAMQRYTDMARSLVDAHEIDLREMEVLDAAWRVLLSRADRESVHADAKVPLSHLRGKVRANTLMIPPREWDAGIVGRWISTVNGGRIAAAAPLFKKYTGTQVMRLRDTPELEKLGVRESMWGALLKCCHNLHKNSVEVSRASGVVRRLAEDRVAELVDRARRYERRARRLENVARRQLRKYRAREMRALRRLNRATGMGRARELSEDDASSTEDASSEESDDSDDDSSSEDDSSDEGSGEEESDPVSESSPDSDRPARNWFRGRKMSAKAKKQLWRKQQRQASRMSRRERDNPTLRKARDARIEALAKTTEALNILSRKLSALSTVRRGIVKMFT